MLQLVDVAPQRPPTQGRGWNYPLKDLAESARTLRRLYRLLSRHAAPSLPSAALWLLDNYSYIRSQIREAKESLSRSYCRKLARAGEQDRAGGPRIYRLSSEALARLPGKLDTEALADFFQPQRLGITLSLPELWAIPLMLRVTVIRELASAALEAVSDPRRSETGVRNAILRLRSLDEIRWRDAIESISVVDRLLGEDPSGAYPEMEFASRDSYRRVIERIARHNGVNEEEVARVALTLAREAWSRHDEDRKSHVGYYLVGPGIEHLRRRGRFGASLSMRF